jgi:hypothetical protein
VRDRYCLFSLLHAIYRVERVAVDAQKECSVESFPPAAVADEPAETAMRKDSRSRQSRPSKEGGKERKRDDIDAPFSTRSL